jgi:hypothetical protein
MVLAGLFISLFLISAMILTICIFN